MGARKKIPQDVVVDVLTSCRRRCCVCFAIRGDDGEKKGQIAHLDRDPNNNAMDNLAFLCLEHHDQYDTTPSQSRGFVIEEVKRYRGSLLAFKSQEPDSDSSSSPPSVGSRLCVPCPRGPSCPGSTPVVVQECYLARTTRHPPGFISNKWEVGLLSSVALSFLDGALDAKYETYQCPACGARVAFTRYRNRWSEVCKRLADDL